MVKRGEKQTAKEDERMELYRQGLTDGQIAKAQGVSSSAIMAWRYRSKLQQNPAQPKTDDEPEAPVGGVTVPINPEAEPKPEPNPEPKSGLEPEPKPQTPPAEPVEGIDLGEMISFAPSTSRSHEAKINIGKTGNIRVSKAAVAMGPSVPHGRALVSLSKDGKVIVFRPGNTGHKTRDDDGGIEISSKQVAKYLKAVGVELPASYSYGVRWDDALQAWTAKLGA